MIVIHLYSLYFIVLYNIHINICNLLYYLFFQMYLSEYGYLSPRVRNPQSGHLMSEEAMSKALMEFQAFANLNLTGIY